MAIVDRHGLPLSVSTHAANHHEVRLVQLCFDFYMIEAKPENLIGDRAYDSDPLDEELRRDGIAMIAPHRANRTRPPTQDRRRLSRYMRRWLVERFFAWIQWQRRILVRWEFHAQNFLGFVQLAASSSSSGDFEIGSSQIAVPRTTPSIRIIFSWTKTYADTAKLSSGIYCRDPQWIRDTSFHTFPPLSNLRNSFCKMGVIFLYPFKVFSPLNHRLCIINMRSVVQMAVEKVDKFLKAF